jgi:hypothetical protein
MAYQKKKRMKIQLYGITPWKNNKPPIKKTSEEKQAISSSLANGTPGTSKNKNEYIN